MLLPPTATRCERKGPNPLSVLDAVVVPKPRWLDAYLRGFQCEVYQLGGRNGVGKDADADLAVVGSSPKPHDCSGGSLLLLSVVAL